MALNQTNDPFEHVISVPGTFIHNLSLAYPMPVDKYTSTAQANAATA